MTGREGAAGVGVGRKGGRIRGEGGRIYKAGECEGDQ
jgi:hypothetical protein